MRYLLLDERQKEVMGKTYNFGVSIFPFRHPHEWAMLEIVARTGEISVQTMLSHMDVKDLDVVLDAIKIARQIAISGTFPEDKVEVITERPYWA